jgi:hypothetical protein
MFAICDVQAELLGEEGICLVFKALVEAVAVQNEFLMKATKAGFPKLYESKVTFRNETLAGRGLEEIATALTVLKRSWGDCDDLVAYRIAELRAQGVAATAKVYVKAHRVKGKPIRLYHVEVRLPDGSVEDPARYLGM